MRMGKPFIKHAVELYLNHDYSNIIQLYGFDMRDLVADYQAGMKQKDMCLKYKIGTVTLWKLVKAIGIYINNTGRNQFMTNKLNAEQLADLYATKSTLETAHLIGVHHRTVSRWLDKYGVDRRSLVTAAIRHSLL